MDGAPQVVSVPVRRRNVLTATMHLITVEVLQSLGSWRWILVPLIYLFTGAYYANLIDFNYVHQQPRSINIWDVPPAFVSNRNLNVWLVALGFMLIIGDNYLRERDRNTLALTITRMPSRTSWWIAKVASVGVLAVVYVGLMFGTILAGSLFSVPFALTDSPQSLIPTTWDDMWYPRLMTIPMPLFVVLVGVYTAFALWVVGCIPLVVSLVLQQAWMPLAVSVGWALMSVSLGPWLSGVRQVGSLPYFIAYAKHFAPRDATSILQFVLVSLSILGIVLAVGVWRLRRLDI